MLPSPHRLTRKRDFEIVMENGRFVNGRYLTAKVWRVDTERFPKRGYQPSDLKFGFVVGKKVDKRAVWRNRVKRQLREATRLLLKEERAETGFLVVVIAKPEIVGTEYARIAEDLVAVLHRAKVLR